MLVFQDIGNNYLEYCDLIIFYLILFFFRILQTSYFFKIFYIFYKIFHFLKLL